MDYFGPTAYKVVVEVGSEYNDQNYDDRITDIRVYNKKGSQIQMDASLPELQKLLQKWKKESWHKDKPDAEILEDESYDLKHGLPIPNGREDHGDEDFEAKYVYVIGEPEPKEPKFLLIEE